MKKFFICFVIVIFAAGSFYPQRHLEKQFKGYTNPEELVSLSPDISFNQAVELLNKVSVNITGKKIISTVDRSEPIGMDIRNMPYDKVLVILVQYANLLFEEREDVIVIKRKGEEKEKSPETYAAVDSREVKISAVFFEMDVNASRERGVNWKFLLSRKGLDVGSEMRSFTEQQQTGGQQQVQQTPEFKVGGSSTFDAGGFFGEATAMFKFFEEENLGEIIASPNIIVRDRNQGRIQVGSDFSVKQRDFAGNIVESFFPTGTIIEVTPFVYTEEGIDYMLLDIKVERSSFVQGEVTTEVRKTTANTQVIMLDEEETVIGGLFINEEIKIRTGIPFLKDLPWWVFGIRYLTGSDQTVLRKKELVILIKAELVPTLKERLAGTKSNSPVRDEILRNRERIRYYQFNQSTDGN